MKRERVTYREHNGTGAFFVEPYDRNEGVLLTDAEHGLAEAFTSYIAFAHLAIESLQAEWTQERTTKVMRRAATLILREFDSGAMVTEPEDMLVELIDALARGTVLRARLYEAKL